MVRKRKSPTLKDAEINLLRRTWHSAMAGNQESKDLLLKLLSGHKSVDAFVRYWVKLKATPLPRKSREDELDDLVEKSLRQKSPPTAWTRGAEAFISGSNRPVSGGLPSLGKRSK